MDSGGCLCDVLPRSPPYELDSLRPNLNTILLMAALALGGCGRKDAEPTGQVVATVDGQEITLEDLHAETGVLSANLDAGSRKAAEQAALQQIVARTIVARYADERKLAATPLAAILRRRAEQEAMVDLVQRQLISEVPQPSREEVELFIRDHPSSFSRRHVFVVDQIIGTDVPPAVNRALERLGTLAEVRQAFDGANVKYTRTVGTIDALAVDPDAAEKLANLPAGAMFISPEGNITRVNQVRAVEILPVPTVDAARLAREAILSARTSSLTQRQLAGIVGAGMSKVRYNAAYQPARPMKAEAP